MLSTLFFISCLVSVWASNWWQINVLYKEVVPNNVYIFENSSVTFYCGSETPEYWMYSGENLDTLGHDMPIRQNHVLGRRQLTLHNVKLNGVAGWLVVLLQLQLSRFKRVRGLESSYIPRS